MPEYVYSVLGTIGAILILLGFYRTSIGQWKNKSFWYELDNTIGALLLIIYQAHLRAYISVVVNAVWAVVAFRGLTSFAERYQGRQKRKRRSRKY
ncbi:MAG TPA: hypothetical protein VM124_00040 [Candidatus Limnocylindrales bacterium]|nr:hypothetical protein [Candidatus Limnocylindrales bacterium]